MKLLTKIILTFGILAFLISLAMFFNLFGGPSSQKLYEQGLSASRNGDSKVAVDKFSEAIKIEKEKSSPDKPLLSTLHNLRGEIYFNEGVAVLSQSDFAYAVEYDPSNESALNNLGIWFTMEQFAKPDYKKSLEYLDKAMAIAPERKDIVLNKAIVKIKSGDSTGCDDMKKLDAEGYPDAKIGLQEYCKNQ